MNIAALDWLYSSAAASSATRVRPDSSVIRFHPVSRAAFANSSKPLVCSRMKPWSSTGAPPLSRARSSASISHLHSPISAAMSPPAFTWWYCSLIRVSAPVPISSGLCGLVKRSQPRSRRGLKVTILTPRRTASCNWCSMRGLLEPTFCPKEKMASQWSKSARVMVPTGDPSTSFSATEVVSWHMLELSGRLLQPYIRASRLYM